MAFHSIPGVQDLLAASKSLNEHIAGQILIFAKEWSHDERSELEMINYLFDQVDQHGAESWSDLRWSMLMRRIHHLSTEINETVHRFAKR